MYSYFQGKVAEVLPDRVVIDCSGVGYEIYTNTRALSQLKAGESAKVYVYLQVKEDDMTLYGFLSKEEKAMFEKLISVSGVGPKIGIAILSAFTASEVAIAIVTNDDKLLSSVSGVGKKTAQRMILELKSRMEKAELIQTQAENGALPLDGQTNVQEAVAILMAMGFDQQDALGAVALVKAEGGSAEDMALAALRTLDKKN